MTCIIGLRHDGKVYIGGDSAGVAGLDYTPRSDTKIWTKKARGFAPGSKVWGEIDFAFGFTTSFRMGQLLHYSLEIPPLGENADLSQYMATSFVDAVRKCLKDGGYASKDKDVESGGTFLVGVLGRLFTIESDYQVGESLRAFESVGCGFAYACGAMAAQTIKDPKKAIMQALAIAGDFSAGVRPPYHVVSV